MWELISHYLLQLAVTVGMIVLAGLVIAGAKHLFLVRCGRAAYLVEVITGFVGTPIHELSHAFFCVIFGHRITAICLWTPHPDNGTLGYVSHSYRKTNLWHQIGNFFIGVAPIIGGTGVLLLLLWLLMPDTAAAILSGAQGLPTEVGALPRALLVQSWTVLKAVFSPTQLLRWQWYLFIVLAVLIVLHMEISRSDLVSGIWGFLFIALALFLVDLVLMLIYPAGLSAVTAGAVFLGAFLASFLCLSVILSAILLLLSLILRIGKR